MKVLIRDRKSAMHPQCGGVMIWQDEGIYKCLDCHKVFKIVGTGIMEHEFEVEEYDGN